MRIRYFSSWTVRKPRLVPREASVSVGCNYWRIILGDSAPSVLSLKKVWGIPVYASGKRDSFGSLIKVNKSYV